MATVLDNSAPTREIFGYGLLFAEDGRAMHKSWGNAIEFNEAADKMGVDVMRWLYCSHKPENNLLFGYTRGDEVRRQFLIPLWNVYNFFVTYANLDGWTPARDGFDPGNPEGALPESDNPLDRWILSRLNRLVARCTETMDHTDPYGATIAVETFLDDLTNWYVRRSRRRFWKSEQDADKKRAYATLYHVSVKLAMILAPFTPFVSEVIYQNLVTTSQADAHGSVHHCDWPKVEEAAIDEDLMQQMDLARRVASMGLSARSSAGIKLRQPLSRVLVHVEDPGLAFPPDLVEIVKDELNVKSFELVEQAGELVKHELLPDNRILGPKFGGRFPKVKDALSAADIDEVLKRVSGGLPIYLEIEGDPVELSADEIIVRTSQAEGLAVAVERGLTIAVDTEISPELRQEGLAREIVRRIQAMRKEADFQIQDRIITYYSAAGDLADVFQLWSDYIQSETLSLRLDPDDPAEDAYIAEHQIDGYEIKLGIRRTE